MSAQEVSPIDRQGLLRRRTVLKGGSLALLLSGQQIAFGASIVAVRVWPANDYTRVTIESDGRLQSRQLVVGNPPRLAEEPWAPPAYFMVLKPRAQ